MKRSFLTVVAILVVVVAVVVMRSDSAEPYTVHLKLANAGGLKPGTPVVIGGVTVGKVDLSTTFKEVTVDLKLDDQYAPIGKDASAAVISQNLLGQKQVSLKPGNVKGDPAPDGYVIPSDKVSQATDLDQLLSTFDTDTRARLAILLNETGTMFAGRKMDYKTFVTEFAPALNSGTNLLTQLTQDNHALENLLTSSNSYIGALAKNRVDVADALNKLGETFETVAAKREELRATIAKAPGGLSAANDFLESFDRTAQPLNDAAVLLTRTAPSLTRALDDVHLFTDATAPVLADFPTVGKSIEFLSDNSTRILQRLEPVAADLKTTATQKLPPVTDTVNKSIDNTIATTVNWASAIQQQDALGHVFRGEAGVSPQYYSSLLKALGADLTGSLLPTKKAAKKQGPAKNNTPPASSPQVAAPNAVQQTVNDVSTLLNNILKPGQTVQQLQQTLDNLGLGGQGKLDLNKLGLNKLGQAQQQQDNGNQQQQAGNLLDFLLGK